METEGNSLTGTYAVGEERTAATFLITKERWTRTLRHFHVSESVPPHPGSGTLHFMLIAPDIVTYLYITGIDPITKMMLRSPGACGTARYNGL